MRMYLSSFRTGHHPDRMVALLHPSARTAAAPVAVIANAVDALPAAERRDAVERELDALAGLGLRPVEVDLRVFFDRPAHEVAAVLARFPLVWVRGGNVFVLRQALARSGADAALIDLLARDAAVYAGYSAAACVLAPDLRGLELCDDPEAVRAAYGDPARWDGLGLLDRVIVPHIDSPGHPETEVLGIVAARYRTEGVPHTPLRDGQALVIDGHDTRVH
ncbi:Type 1 glutamine amidotransferase-like domain-containing protein (plasmid) [Streptomyces sp. BI20]|uniref:Type 1 glutamine amidotransferase-like domain-containing protein n=1 Tax=Streptomyces sp. BI20 TaxID=3403460 RepID=UPI003C79051C